MIFEVTVLMVCGLTVLSLISGMLGLGVAFAAIPFLSMFMVDLVREVQPLALLLNGFTALFSAIGFSRSGFVDWRKAMLLAVVTTSSAPVGSFLVMYVPQVYVWVTYFAAVLYLAYRLFRPVKVAPKRERYLIALLLAIPISILSGFLGVGPGFLLMPTLIIVGFEPKKAAGINAVAVCPPSFSALIPRLGNISIDLAMAFILLIVSTLASYLGARITSKYMPGATLKKLFGLLIVVMTLYRLLTILTSL
ncbi:MAG: sulfite exporter TauE/SafE family protein [Sulfolobales archaeon]